MRRYRHNELTRRGFLGFRTGFGPGEGQHDALADKGEAYCTSTHLPRGQRAVEDFLGELAVQELDLVLTDRPMARAVKVRASITSSAKLAPVFWPRDGLLPPAAAASPTRSTAHLLCSPVCTRRCGVPWRSGLIRAKYGR